MSKGIGRSIGLGVLDVYVVEYYSAHALVGRSTLHGTSIDDAIGQGLRRTVAQYDDGLTRVDIRIVGRTTTSYEVVYKDTYTLIINGITYDTSAM